MPKDTWWELELDQTAFFPEGGGQPADMGWLDTVRVLDVREEDGRVHVSRSGQLALRDYAARHCQVVVISVAVLSNLLTLLRLSCVFRQRRSPAAVCMRQPHPFRRIRTRYEFCLRGENDDMPSN